jgi:ketosteroid isomerase-like protein
MSQEENVEVLRRLSEQFSRTGETDFSVIDPGAVFDNSNAIFDGAVYRGHDGVRTYVSLLRGMWEGVRFEPQEFIAVDEDRVIVAVRMVMRGRDEIETVAHSATLYTFSEGKITHAKAFQSKAEALDAVGLRESAMPQENVERAYRVWDAVSRRDLDAHLALYDPDVEIEPRTAVAVGISYRGQDGVRRWWDDMLSAFPDIGMEVLEARDLGDLTLTATSIRGHGAGSDVLVEQTLWQVIEWRDKKCVWWGSFGSEREALEAMGLRE